MAQLLLGSEVSGAGAAAARVAGISLLALGAASWSGAASLGLLVYSGLVTLYLAYLGIRGERVGVLLWPAVAVHAVLTLLLARIRLSPGRDSG